MHEKKEQVVEKKIANKTPASFGNQPTPMNDETLKNGARLAAEEEFARDTKRAKIENIDALETENNALKARNAALVKENDVLETDNRNIVIQNKLLTADLLAANIKIGDLMPEVEKVPGLEKELKEALRSAAEYKTGCCETLVKNNELKAKLEAKK